MVGLLAAADHLQRRFVQRPHARFIATGQYISLIICNKHIMFNDHTGRLGKFAAQILWPIVRLPFVSTKILLAVEYILEIIPLKLKIGKTFSSVMALGIPDICRTMYQQQSIHLLCHHSADNSRNITKLYSVSFQKFCGRYPQHKQPGWRIQRQPGPEKAGCICRSYRL